MFWEPDTDAAQFINGQTGTNSFQKVLSNDIYWFTDLGVACSQGEGGQLLAGGSRAMTQAECRLAASGGAGGGQDAPPRREGRPEAAGVELPGVRPPLPRGERSGHHREPQLRAAVWHSLIAGSGIIYFNHTFGGTHAGDHHTIRSNSEGTRPAVTSVNAQVKALAPVLNAPYVEGWYRARRECGRWRSGRAASSGCSPAAETTAARPTRSAGRASATPQPRSTASPAPYRVTNGQLTDTFGDGNAIHIYRDGGGSTCGLPAG